MKNLMYQRILCLTISSCSISFFCNASTIESGIQTLGKYPLAIGQSLYPTAKDIINSWATLPQQTKEVLLGGALLATAAYKTPAFYRYLRGTIKKKRTQILNLAQSFDTIPEGPLRNIQNALSPLLQGNSAIFYITLLISFNKLNLAHTPRGDLLFFKYLKAFTEDEIFAKKDTIHTMLSTGICPPSSYLQRWVTGRSEQIYKELKELIAFNKDLSDIIAQLEAEIDSRFNIY